MNDTKPLISVIVPNYNHSEFLEQRLQSILNQTYQNFEIILLDDASTDSSIDVLENYKNHPKVSNFIKNKENSNSPFKQWKKGIDFAIGEYIWIAESDDYSSKYFLENMIRFISENSKTGLVYCQSIDVNESGEKLLNRIQYTRNFLENIWENNFMIDGAGFIKKYLSAYNVIPNASAVLFKKTLVNSNIFSEALLRMKMCGDWFFWIQIVKQTHVGFISDPQNYFRNHGSVTRNHYTSMLKKQRLLEEKKIRSFLQYSNNSNPVYEQSLYYRWFVLFQVKELLKTFFYSIKLPKTTYFQFLYYYFRFKAKQKLKYFIK